MKLAAEGYYMKIKLNIFLFFFVTSGVQAHPNDSFKELFNRARKLETFKDVIKDKNYYDQRACFIRGNCDHPMDTLAHSLNNSQLTVKKFVKMFYEEQYKGHTEQIKKKFELDDAYWTEKVEKRIIKMEDEMKEEPIGKVQYKQLIDEENLDPQLKQHIEKLHNEFRLKGDLTVSYWEFSNSPASIAETRYGRTAEKILFLGREFFNVSLEDQEAIIDHEFGHGKNRLNFEYKKKALDLINFGSSLDYQICEYVADQYPASRNLRSAKLLENYFLNVAKEIYADHRCSGSNKYQFRDVRVAKQSLGDKLPLDECYTHPCSLKRYDSIKTIRQLHEAVDRKAQNQHHPKYTQKSYEKYVVGYEKAWDRWCRQQENESIF